MEKEKLNGTDIPTEYTSSIGATVWPPEKASFEKRKGIYPQILETSDQLKSVVDEFATIPFELNTTRFSARICVTATALRDYINKHNPSELIETIIPLTGTNSGLDNCCLVYIGKNDQARIPPPDLPQRQLAKAKGIFNYPGEKKPLDQEFKIKMLSQEQRQDPNILNMYFELYQYFGWLKEDVRKLLQNNNNLIVACFYDGKIVSSGLAEMGVLTFNEIPLNIAEITEAATLPACQGRGLYQAVSDAILQNLATNGIPPNLVFGELNLHASGVLTVAARQGRIPAFQTAEYFDTPHAWVLPQHVTIKNGYNDLPYNNLMVAYLNQQLLLEKYGK
jgi:hypothetical protein